MYWRVPRDLIISLLLLAVAGLVYGAYRLVLLVLALFRRLVGG